jgi:hypothetical protein
MHQKEAAEFTKKQLSAFLAYLRQEKSAPHCGQGTCPSNPATGTTTGGTTLDNSINDATTNSTDHFLRLHWNNK